MDGLAGNSPSAVTLLAGTALLLWLSSLDFLLDGSLLVLPSLAAPESVAGASILALLRFLFRFFCVGGSFEVIIGSKVTES